MRVPAAFPVSLRLARTATRKATRTASLAAAGFTVTLLAALWMAAAPRAQANPAAPAAAEPASSAPRVPTVVVQASTSSAGFVLDAQVQAQRQATVAVQIGGTVTALLVKAGDRVRSGQVLARIDERDTAAGLARSDAAVAQAEADAQNAQLAAERARALRAQGFVSQSAVDAADSQLKAAQARVREAQAGRSQAALARGFAAVTAPFDGVVQETLLDAGDLAGAGRPVLTLYAPGALRAVVQVPASRAAAARAAAQVQIQLPDGSSVAPLRRSVLPATDPVAQTVEWRLDLPPAAAAQLSPGQSLRVSFEGAAAAGAAGAASSGALSLPASAVLRRGELTAVYVAQGTQFVLRAVRLGASRGDRVELLAGLKTGERVAQDAVRAGLFGAQPVVTP